MSDLRNAMGLSPLRAIPRLLRGLAALRAGIRGTAAASGSLPIRVQLEITDRCNFDCMMCNRNAVIAGRARRRNDLDVEQVVALIDALRPAYVTLNGNGEPLLYRGLRCVLAACRARGITTAMPTNLSLVSGARLEALLAEPPTILTCSLYGTNEDTFRTVTGARGHERCAANLAELVKRLPDRASHLRVLIAVHAGNADDHGETFDFLSALGLLDVTNLVPTHDYDHPNGDGRAIPADDRLAASLERLDRALAVETDPARGAFLRRWGEALRALRARGRVDETSPCLVPWISTYVDAVGDVRPCCYLSDAPHVMGNVNDTPFAEIWNGERYRDFRRRMTRGREGLEVCRRCARNDAPRIERYRLLAGTRTQWQGAGGDIPVTVGDVPGSGARG